MTQSQRSDIVMELNRLRKRKSSEYNQTKHAKLKKRIADLEFKLNKLEFMKHSKSDFNISNIDTDGNLNIQNQTNHHHYYTSSWIIRILSVTHWKRLTAQLLALGLTLLLAAKWIGFFPFNIPPNTRVENQLEGLSKSEYIPLPSKEKLSNNSKEISTVQSTKKSINTFKISSFSKKTQAILQKGLEKNGQWTFGKNGKVDFKIEIDHSGHLIEVSDQYYRYSGGYVQIKINNQECCCEDFLKIDLNDHRAGNLMHLLENKIQNKIDQLITQNLDNVISIIENCTG